MGHKRRKKTSGIEPKTYFLKIPRNILSLLPSSGVFSTASSVGGTVEVDDAAEGAPEVVADATSDDGAVAAILESLPKERIGGEEARAVSRTGYIVESASGVFGF